MNIETLPEAQKATRRRIIEISYRRKLAHLGSCLTAIDLVDAVYKVKKGSEKFVLSNGHAGLALYIVLEKHNLLPPEVLNEISIHPDRNNSLHIDASTGSLGQGLPIALGMALADRRKNVYCTVSDGECSEGSIWEALNIAAEQNVGNLKTLVNANGWGAYDPVPLKPLYNKFIAFGCNVIEVDGHDVPKITEALSVENTTRPQIIFARTEINQLPFLEGQKALYHQLNEQDYTCAMKLLK